MIMESLYKLKHAEQHFKKVVVTHDMTKAERDECKRMVTEAKDKEAQDPSGEYIYRVRGLPGKMKIIKNKNASYATLTDNSKSRYNKKASIR